MRSIFVKRDAINRGYRKSPKRCALALSAKEQLDQKSVSVGYNQIRIGQNYYNPTKALTQWLRDFDACNPICAIRVILDGTIARLRTIDVKRLVKSRNGRTKEV